MSHHKFSFVLIPFQHRSFSIIPFGLGIFPFLCDVHTYFLDVL